MPYRSSFDGKVYPTVEETLEQQRQVRLRQNSPIGRVRLSLQIIRALIVRRPDGSALSSALSTLEEGK